MRWCLLSAGGARRRCDPLRLELPHAVETRTCREDAPSIDSLPAALQLEMDMGFSIHFLFHDENPFLESNEIAAFCLVGGQARAVAHAVLARSPPRCDYRSAGDCRMRCHRSRASTAARSTLSPIRTIAAGCRGDCTRVGGREGSDRKDGRQESEAQGASRREGARLLVSCHTLAIILHFSLAPMLSLLTLCNRLSLLLECRLHAFLAVSPVSFACDRH